ncbi:MAG: class I SAM-dependent methyltransferase [Desulfobacterales bacterium]|nr:class I SAM-dependent methyltransferase [Desulfobacterales bacterium]
MQEDKQEVVKNAFGRNVQKYLGNDPRENWWYYQVSKVKTDYRLINYIGLRDKIVLNVGGFFPIDEVFFAPRVKEFYSIDISPEVIKFAKGVADFELPQHLSKKLHFQIADAADLPFEDNFFDVSMSFSTLEHIPGENKRGKAFGEMARVTKRGGR